MIGRHTPEDRKRVYVGLSLAAASHPDFYRRRYMQELRRMWAARFMSGDEIKDAINQTWSVLLILDLMREAFA